MTNFLPEAGSRISWAALFAGVVVTLVMQLLLSILGIAIGASTVAPLQEQDPTAGLGIGAGVWFLLTSLVSLFAGGWTAGRMAGIPRVTDSTLHGILTWGLATLLTFYLLTTTVGSLIGGAARALGQGASLLGQGVAAASPGMADAVKGQMREQGVDWESIKQEAQSLLRQTGKPELQPEALKTQAKEAGADAKATAGTAAENPQATDQQFDSLLDRLYNRGSATVSAADRDAAINVLAERTGKTKDEAAKIVDRWEETYQQARAKYEEVSAQAGQKAREVGDAAARNVSRAALWSFLAMLVGMGAAGFGGRVATPQDVVEVEDSGTTRAITS